MTGHTGPGNGAGVAARIQHIEDLEAVRAIPACYGYGHDLIFKHLGGDQRVHVAASERIDRLRLARRRRLPICHASVLTAP